MYGKWMTVKHVVKIPILIVTQKWIVQVLKLAKICVQWSMILWLAAILKSCSKLWGSITSAKGAGVVLSWQIFLEERWQADHAPRQNYFCFLLPVNVWLVNFGVLYNAAVAEGKLCRLGCDFFSPAVPSATTLAHQGGTLNPCIGRGSRGLWRGVKHHFLQILLTTREPLQ